MQRAGLFGTAAGEVYQVVDLPQRGGGGKGGSAGQGRLQNCITFPPEGSFVVDSTLDFEGGPGCRCTFKFTGAALQLPGGRRLRLPPVGSGWFDSVYADDRLRVAVDSRGDTLVVARDGPPRTF